MSPITNKGFSSRKCQRLETRSSAGDIYGGRFKTGKSLRHVAALRALGGQIEVGQFSHPAHCRVYAGQTDLKSKVVIGGVMKCEIYRDLEQKLSLAKAKWAQYAYLQNRHLWGTSAEQAGGIAAEMQRQMKELSVKMSDLQQGCPYCLAQ